MPQPSFPASNPAAEEADAAWVQVALAVTPEYLREFLLDVERLLRINPCLEFESLTRAADGRYLLAGHNESNAQAFALTASLSTRPADGGLVLRYAEGIKRETRFEIAAAPSGSTLRIVDTYDAAASGAAQGGSPTPDRSLVPWATALRAHLRRRLRWGAVPGYAWLVDRLWLRMPPRQRRLSWLILWTSALEFVAFVAILAIWLTAA